MGIYCAFCPWESEDIAFVWVELESGWLVAVIHDVQKSISGGFKLHFSEMNGCAWKGHIVAESLAHAWKLNCISSVNIYAVLSAGVGTWHAWGVSDLDWLWSSWSNGSCFWT